MQRHPAADPAELFHDLQLPAFSSCTDTPIVLAIEGPNGAGKTTLAHALSHKLGARYCLGTDKAWFDESFKVRMIRDADWFASAMFFLSGCFEQSRQLRAASDRLVIMDRCLWSTLAVHGATNPDRLRALLQMLWPIASEIQPPHTTLVLDASFETCQARIAKKAGTARALDELTATPEFHARERTFYRWLGRHSASVRFLETDTSDSQEVAAKAEALLSGILPTHGS